MPLRITLVQFVGWQMYHCSTSFGLTDKSPCDLVFKILTKSGHVIHTSPVEPVTPEERDTDAYKKLINDYDKAII